MRVLKKAALAAAFFASVLGMVVGAAGPASAKSFSLPSVVVEAVLGPDGSLHVVEHIAYDFSGSFTKGTRPIPRGDYRIVDMTVSDRGRALPIHGAPYDLSWDYSATNERRTFDISYTVVGATRFGSDVGELYWKWVGTEHPSVDAVQVRLTVPGAGVGVKAWAHGPKHGIVQPGKVTTFDVVVLPGGEFVEGRVAVPVAAFTAATPGTSPRLPIIEAEELGFIQRDARHQQDLARLRGKLQWAGLAFVPALLAFLVIWRRWGNDPDPPVPVGEYVHEPLDDPPCVVVGLVHMGQVRPEAFGATVMDLAQRGHLTIEETTQKKLFRDKKDWRFTRTQSDDRLEPFEAHILDRIFHEGPVTTQSELTEWAKANPAAAKSFWGWFEKAVQRELKHRAYLKGGRALPFFLNIVVVVLVAAAAVTAVASTRPLGLVLGGVCLVTAVLVGFGTLLLRSRTPQGAQRAAEWKAFERKVRDFSQMEDAPAGHLVLWERYLVYAVALGVSQRLAHGLAMRVPAEQRSSFAPWYIGSDGGYSDFGRMADFGSSFGGAVHSAMVPSSSGGGGGFSGGGGGGGGGGGIGAS
jgi:uncharacterized membrane protein